MYRLLFIPLGLCLFIVSYAQGTSMITLAQNNFNRSIVELAAIEKTCDSTRILPISIRDNLTIPDAQLRIALTYFYFKTQFDCSRAGVYRYLLDSAALSIVHPQKAKTLQDGHHLVMSTYIQLLNAKAEFATLPDGLKKKLMAMPIFSTPFDLIPSAHQLLPVPEEISENRSTTVRSDLRVSKFLAPPVDPAYHLEIPQP